MTLEKPDLLLLDVLIPHLPGFELLEAVREHTLLGATPIIILTAQTTAASKPGLSVCASDAVRRLH